MGSLYSAHRTWLHAVPAAGKLAFLTLLSVALFALSAWPALLAITLGCVVLFASLGRAALAAKRLLLGVLIASALVAGLHLLLRQPELALTPVLRLLCTTLMGSALTLTTPYSDLLQVFEQLLRPLRVLGVRTERWALQLALMLRFVEHFFVLWQRLDEAHRLRTGKAGGVRLLAPLTIQMLLTARRVADTLFLRLPPEK